MATAYERAAAAAGGQGGTDGGSPARLWATLLKGRVDGPYRYRPSVLPSVLLCLVS
jgi:hypothetical protein